MKCRVYKVVVDSWRLAAKYGFRRMGDGDWQDFIKDGQNLILRYRAEGYEMERLCRDLLDAFQQFYKRL